MNKILFLLGTLLLVLPVGIKMVEDEKKAEMIATYQREMKALDTEKKEEGIVSAKSYNEHLFITKEIDLEQYEEELNLFGNGMMGYLEIPKISLKLPIYHGTEEEVLANGIGHLRESSLPVGGENTHCVLTGHRGLPNAQLFTRLDELEEGDLFFMNINQMTMSYRVREINVVKPEDTETLAIRAEEDLVSLVTCTPYGINTHRLIVTGERIPDREVLDREVLNSDFEIQTISKRDWSYLLVPVVFLAINMIWNRRKGERQK